MFGFRKKYKIYGEIGRGKSFIKIKAPSGEEALRIAGVTDSHYVANHQGGGIYYIERESQPGESGITPENMKGIDKPVQQGQRHIWTDDNGNFWEDQEIEHDYTNVDGNCDCFGFNVYHSPERQALERVLGSLGNMRILDTWICAQNARLMIYSYEKLVECVKNLGLRGTLTSNAIETLAMYISDGDDVIFQTIVLLGDEAFTDNAKAYLEQE